jgi:hypothetical protein
MKDSSLGYVSLDKEIAKMEENIKGCKTEPHGFLERIGKMERKEMEKIEEKIEKQINKGSNSIKSVAEVFDGLLERFKKLTGHQSWMSNV